MTRAIASAPFFDQRRPRFFIRFASVLSICPSIVPSDGVLRQSPSEWHWDSARGIYRFYKDGKVMGDPPPDLANNAGAGVFISIHNNAGPIAARGTETWSAWDDDLGRRNPDARGLRVLH